MAELWQNYGRTMAELWQERSKHKQKTLKNMKTYKGFEEAGKNMQQTSKNSRRETVETGYKYTGEMNNLCRNSGTWGGANN